MSISVDLIHPLVLESLAAYAGTTVDAVIARLNADEERLRNERVLEAIVEKRIVSKRRDRRIDGRYYEQAAIEYRKGKIGGMIRKAGGRVEVLLEAGLAEQLVVASVLWRDFLAKQGEGAR